MEESILKAATIALALASIAALGSGIVRAETEDVPFTYLASGTGTPAGTGSGDITPEMVGTTGTAELPRVTVTCSKVCQANGSLPGNGLDLVPSYPAPSYNHSDRDGPAAPAPAPTPTPPPSSPPPIKEDCLKNCDNDRKIRDLKCADESYRLYKKLYDNAVMAARAKLFNKFLGDADIVSDAVLLTISQRQESFNKFCANVSDQAELYCREQVCAKLSYFLMIPFGIVGFRGLRRVNDA